MARERDAGLLYYPLKAQQRRADRLSPDIQKKGQKHGTLMWRLVGVSPAVFS